MKSTWQNWALAIVTSLLLGGIGNSLASDHKEEIDKVEAKFLVEIAAVEAREAKKVAVLEAREAKNFEVILLMSERLVRVEVYVESLVKAQE